MNALENRVLMACKPQAPYQIKMINDKTQRRLLWHSVTYKFAFT